MTKQLAAFFKSYVLTLFSLFLFSLTAPIQAEPENTQPSEPSEISSSAEVRLALYRTMEKQTATTQIDVHMGLPEQIGYLEPARLEQALQTQATPTGKTQLVIFTNPELGNLAERVLYTEISPTRLDWVLNDECVEDSRERPLFRFGERFSDTSLNRTYWTHTETNSGNSFGLAQLISSLSSRPNTVVNIHVWEGNEWTARQALASALLVAPQKNTQSNVRLHLHLGWVSKVPTADAMSSAATLLAMSQTLHLETPRIEVKIFPGMDHTEGLSVVEFRRSPALGILLDLAQHHATERPMLEAIHPEAVGQFTETVRASVGTTLSSQARYLRQHINGVQRQFPGVRVPNLQTLRVELAKIRRLAEYSRDLRLGTSDRVLRRGHQRK